MTPVNTGTGVYRDGTSSRKRVVELRFSDKLDIREDGRLLASWPYDDIRRADGPHVLRLSSLSALPLARLEIDNEALAQEVSSRCRSLDAGRSGAQTGRIVGWSLAAACSIVLVTLYGIPFMAERLASFLPFSIEKRIGGAVDKQVRLVFSGWACNRPEGQAAFTAMMTKLAQAGEVDFPVDANVWSSPIPNAFALPGGKIYLFNGLLQKARNPDEVAGVIAHELGHARHRDSLRKVIQTGSTSFLIGLLLGDVTGGGAVILAARTIINASYSREAESDADAFAVMVMRKLGRSPRPMGEFLVRVTDEGKKPTSTIIDSHPMSAERLAQMSKDDRPVTGPDILSAQEWNALKDICKR